ncbi:hypothetical protein CJ030_MR8G021845 [Morella rubra]|uniref:Xylosyltransferase 1 n=1 Tax=Morella rubra TaxID=262757 RepID=A0A6A1UW21_9ROSI|nr:hypothetical protein CJ030_MR8G021845 [Morella rubra]
MKTVRAWHLGLRDIMIMSWSRKRSHLKRPKRIVLLVSLVSIFLLGAYVYPPRSSVTCYVFSSARCGMLEQHPSTELTDEEFAARVVFKEILNTPPVESRKPKIAFMFLTPDSLPFEMLWDNFQQIYFICVFGHRVAYAALKKREMHCKHEIGHENRFTVYVHSSKEKPVHVSPHFIGRDILSDKVVWGEISMVDAEKRLLANALTDPDNQQFVLLSDSCVPLHSFKYVYHYLMFTNVSFIDCFVDPGPYGTGRYAEHMLPEVEEKYFRKASQWFSMKRQHALMVLTDSLYYQKFRLYCRPNMEHKRNCYADEHYLPTLFNMIDPTGIANWSVTHVDWSEGKWHPKTYRAPDVTYELLKNITSFDESIHVTSDEKWFSMKRQHALMVLTDSLYYQKFRLYCRSDLALHSVFPTGIANWSVTHVDWSEGKWHPKTYRAPDVTYELLKNITSFDESIHVTSDEKV